MTAGHIYRQSFPDLFSLSHGAMNMVAPVPLLTKQDSFRSVLRGE